MKMLHATGWILLPERAAVDSSKSGGSAGYKQSGRKNHGGQHDITRTMTMTAGMVQGFCAFDVLE